MEFEVENGFVWGIDSKGVAEIISSEIWVSKRVVNIVSNCCSIILEYKLNAQTGTVEIERKFIESTSLNSLLLNLGIYVNQNKLKCLVEYLQLTEEKAEIEFIHNKIGFKEINGSLHYLLDKNITKDGVLGSTYAGTYKIQEKGSFDVWHQFASELVANVNMALALTIGLSAPIVALLREPLGLDNLYFNFYGTSSTGKTSACYFLLSAFGFPLKTSDGLMLTYNSTHNALIGSLADNNGVPMVIDEASVKGNFDFSSFIYIMADGRDKMRQTKAGVNKIPAKWNTTVVSTSEMSLLENSNKNLGIYMRLIELSHINWTSSASEAEKIKLVFSQNYGHAGKIFVEKLMQVPLEELVKKYVDAKEAVLAYMNADDNFSNRLAEKYAVIMLTSQYTNEFLNLNVPTEILNVLIEAKNGKNEELDQAENALEFIINYTVANVNSFYVDDRSKLEAKFSDYRNKQIPNRTVIGKLEIDATGFKTIAITRQKFDEVLKSKSFNDVTGILAKWRDDGVIETYAGRFTKRVSFYETSPSVNAVVINVPQRYKADNGIEVPNEWIEEGGASDE